LVESEMSFNSVYYCPDCTDGGKLMVKDDDKYFKGKPYTYYCLKCKTEFKIERIINNG